MTLHRTGVQERCALYADGWNSCYLLFSNCQVSDSQDCVLTHHSVLNQHQEEGQDVSADSTHLEAPWQGGAVQALKDGGMCYALKPTARECKRGCHRRSCIGELVRAHKPQPGLCTARADGLLYL